jgi:hypothetical protein
VIVCTSLSHR